MGIWQVLISHFLSSKLCYIFSKNVQYVENILSLSLPQFRYVQQTSYGLICYLSFGLPWYQNFRVFSIIPKYSLLSKLVAQTIHNVLKKMQWTQNLLTPAQMIDRLGFDGTSGFFCAFLRSGFPFSVSKLILKRGRRNQKRALDCGRGPGKVNLNNLETL